MRHHGHHRAGIEPAREERADGHVAHEVAPHRVLELHAQLGAPVRLGPALVGFELEVPVALDTGLAAVEVEHQQGGRRQLADGAEDGAGARHVVIREVVAEGLPVQVAGHAGILEKALQLGGVEEAPAVPGIDHGLDANAVPGEEQPPAAAIPQGEREHPAQVAQALLPMRLVGAQQHLRVRGGGESMPGRQPTRRARASR